MPHSTILFLRNMAGLLLAMLLLSSCASLVGPRDVDLPLDKLQAQLNQRFPANSRYLEVFDITLGQPKITLLPLLNRVRFDVDITIAPPFTSKRLQSFVSLSGALKIDHARKAVMLVEPKVEALKLDGVDAIMGRQFNKLGNYALERMFQDNPVHRFKDDDLQVAGLQFVATNITIHDQRLVLHIEPAK
ncbi:MAG: hypothetical protein RL748_4560 [Pseudomonadota bacterium]